MSTTTMLDMRKIIDMIVKDDPAVKTEFTSQLEMEVQRMLAQPQIDEPAAVTPDRQDDGNQTPTPES